LFSLLNFAIPQYQTTHLLAARSNTPAQLQLFRGTISLPSLESPTHIPPTHLEHLPLNRKSQIASYTARLVAHPNHPHRPQQHHHNVTRRRLGPQRRQKRPRQNGRPSSSLGIRPRARRKIEYKAQREVSRTSTLCLPTCLLGQASKGKPPRASLQGSRSLTLLTTANPTTHSRCPIPIRTTPSIPLPHFARENPRWTVLRYSGFVSPCAQVWKKESGHRPLRSF
jgi:hypothetical protein